MSWNRISWIAMHRLALVLSALAGTTAAAARANPYEAQHGTTPHNPIDRAVFAQLARLGIEAASPIPDAVFMRRLYLDAIGTLPTAAEVSAFLADTNPAKRDALIDAVLARDEFADYWAMKWGDLLRIKSEFPINLWPNAVQAYDHWVRASLRQNLPYDRFVRELLTANGSNFRVPQVNFYRAVQSKDAQTLAQVVALTFMGVRAETWPADTLAAMAAFFSQVNYKSTAEWKEEIVFFDPGRSGAQSPVQFPDGTPAVLAPGQDPRELFCSWLITPQNPWFTRNIANRVWSWLLGRGVIHEADDIRPDNPPVNPELLACLERELVTAHYDLKTLFRLILQSRTYQLSCVPASQDPRAAANFAFYPVRRLEAEVLIDAINQITGGTEKYVSAIPEPFTFIPESQRSIALADASITSPFLELYGRSSRDTGLEAERNRQPSAAQRLYLLNSSTIQNKLQQSPRLRALLRQPQKGPYGIVCDLYLTMLSRYPTNEEMQILKSERAASQARATASGNPRIGAELPWVLINTAEFQFRH